MPAPAFMPLISCDTRLVSRKHSVDDGLADDGQASHQLKMADETPGCYWTSTLHNIVSIEGVILRFPSHGGSAT